MIQGPYKAPAESFEVPAERFHGPIDYSPIDEYAPTPLDPEAAEYAKVPAVHTIAIGLSRRAEEAATLHRLPRKLAETMEYELRLAHERRSNKNRASFDRLLKQIEGKELDDAMAQIIEKARQSAADPQELLRLIKEYPDMISLEFFKGHSVLDIERYKEINNRLTTVLETLRSSFQDAEVLPCSDEERRKSGAFAFGTGGGVGVCISREKVAEARSVDSRVEILVKNSFLVLPKDLIHPYPSMAATIQGEERTLLPLATMAYFRTVNFQQRLQTLSATGKELGAIAVEGDPILAKIPPEMRSAYLETRNSPLFGT